MAKLIKMYTYDIYWSPTGQKIATVQAPSAKAALRQVPAHWKKYKGEMYVVAHEVNPRIASIPRDKWITAKIRVTKSGKIEAQMPRSEVRTGTGVKSLYSKSGRRRIVRTN